MFLIKLNLEFFQFAVDLVKRREWREGAYY